MLGLLFRQESVLVLEAVKVIVEPSL